MNTFVPGQDRGYASSYTSGSPFIPGIRVPSDSKIRTGTSLAAGRPNGRLVARRIARSLLGRAVTIRLDSGGTIHGIVTEVLADSSKPKVVVGGAEYQVAQLLTAAPPEIAPEGPARSSV